ncbi:MAG: MscL family protein [Bdellovibrionales bacterium]|nr:MscL family protein [Bdellovibrionales bacterium]
MIKEFLAFLDEYKVTGLAIAVIIGAKAGDLVKAMVDQLIMPFVGILVPGGDWRAMTFEIGGAKFGIGIFAGALLDFIIVAFVVFTIAKMVLKQDKVTKM